MKTIEAAIKLFKVTEDELLDESRKKGVISKARHFIMWYHRKILNESFRDCADVVCMSKAAAIYGVKTLDSRIESDEKLSNELLDYTLTVNR